MTNSIDPRDFRNALGQFATGVTVITSLDQSGGPVGCTVSSFNSVSIDPPLVLWSLAKDSGSLEAYQASGYFCVHVLSAAQEDLSGRFASSGIDKFEGIDWQAGEGGAPLLPEFAAQFQCKTTYQYEGGDHVIFVGEVLSYEKTEEPPLVFHRGRYALAKSKASKEKPGDAVDLSAGNFTDNFFLYLLSRAHYQSSAKLRGLWQQAGLNHSEYLSLTVLGMSNGLSWQELHDRIEHTGYAPELKTLENMREAGWITESSDGHKFSITVKGRELYLSLLAVSKTLEEELLEDFSEAEVADVREFLKRFINKSNPGIPNLWPEEE